MLGKRSPTATTPGPKAVAPYIIAHIQEGSVTPNTASSWGTRAQPDCPSGTVVVEASPVVLLDSPVVVVEAPVVPGPPVVVVEAVVSSPQETRNSASTRVMIRPARMA